MHKQVKGEIKQEEINWRDTKVASKICHPQKEKNNNNKSNEKLVCTHPCYLQQGCEKNKLFYNLREIQKHHNQ